MKIKYLELLNEKIRKLSDDFPYVLAALVEAWHVDGYYKRAAEGWEILSLNEYNSGLAKIKSAISFLSCGEEEKGFKVLNENRSIHTEDYFYISAIHHWNKGKVIEALNFFHEALRQGIRSVEILNALGFINWKIGAKKKAIQYIIEAFEKDEENPEVLINLVSLNLHNYQVSTKVHLLQKACSLKPNGFEPFVLISRVYREGRKIAKCNEALAKAKIRKKRLLVSKKDLILPFNKPRKIGQATLSGKISEKLIQLSIQYILPQEKIEFLPQYFALNKNYRKIIINGKRIVSKKLAENCQFSSTSFSPNVNYYQLLETDWEFEKGFVRVEITLEGQPIPPLIHLSDDRIELNAKSGWMPVLCDQGIDFFWQFNLIFPDNYCYYFSDELFEFPGISLIAITKAETFIYKKIGGENLHLKVIGKSQSGSLRIAAYIAGKAIEIWENILHTKIKNYPRIVIIDNPQSTFNYCRSSYMRLSSGIFKNMNQVNLIFHEIGHIWWGVNVKFSPDAKWLVEALAEYTLHIAQEKGIISNYTKLSLKALQASNGGMLPEESLLSLSADSSKHKGYALRVKGGFVLLMLSKILEEKNFFKLLKIAFQYGTRRGLNAYTFMALASDVYGKTLNWFFNQWVYLDTKMTIYIKDVEAFQIERSSYFLTFTAYCDGLATPGAPIEFRVQTENGETYSFWHNLDLGMKTITVEIGDAPIKIMPDPNYYWYAMREDWLINQPINK